VIERGVEKGGGMKRQVGVYAWLILGVFLAVALAADRGLAQPKPKVPAPFTFEQVNRDDQGNVSPGKVTFDHDKHMEKGQKCASCHGKDKPFKTKKGTSTDITMKAIDAGKACGTCHNGAVSFSTKDKDNCVKCHKKET
jgi:c(7)-type cytochrome triheme protein